jgi:hypothetical protein
MTSAFDVKHYLKSLNKATNRGVCKTCDKEVYCSKDKLFSHKRKNCFIPENEIQLWKAKPTVISEIVELSSLASSVCSSSRFSVQSSPSPCPSIQITGDDTPKAGRMISQTKENIAAEIIKVRYS